MITPPRRSIAVRRSEGSIASAAVSPFDDREEVAEKLRSFQLDVLPVIDIHGRLIGAIRHELKDLLGVEVDVLTPNGLPPKFREQVLREAVLL